MNILILFTQPWRTGGAETHVQALLKGLSAHNIFLAVNYGSSSDKLNTLEQLYPNVHVLTIQARGINIFKWYKSFQALKSLLKIHHIDIIACQQRTAGIWASLLSKNSSIKYTVTMHDPWHRAKIKKIYPHIFPQMIAVSKNLAAILEKNYGFPAKHIRIINNGIDFSIFYPMEQLKARQQLSLSQAKKIILHVSRMSSIKGAVSLLIIDTLHHLAEKGQFYNTILIGEGPLRTEIDHRAQLFNAQYGQWITVRNFVSNIAAWYNAADILIGEGRVAIECLACEKPVIAIRNSHSFIGLITQANIAYACDVNFDGQDKPATVDNMAVEINKAFALPPDEPKAVAAYIKEHLSINKMARAYINTFTNM
ncbi:glycosyltransferase [Pectinatus sottacetonis]|uniref:glycosyltransferase n=1 Tax=Pectinatus sottacetonis TaxID=1002795 RepID=UPI0018C794D2|nr:glycosyltransferase [Pectinatus sottacetonis]